MTTSELTTNQKGAIAEAAVAQAAIELGLGVFKSFADERYDFVFDLGSRLVRVQCKWAVRRGDVVVVRCCSSRRTASGFEKRPYSPDEIDAYAGYCRELGRCYFLPVECFPHARAIQLRLGPTRNGQFAGINWASDFEFGATLGPDRGAIAQLGEHLHGMQGVAGSSPASSTEPIAQSSAWPSPPAVTSLGRLPPFVLAAMARVPIEVR